MWTLQHVDYQQKTKTMTIAVEESGRQNIMEQIMEFNCLGTSTTNSAQVENEVNVQVVKTNIVAGCMNDLVWNIKYLRIDTKARVYKNTRPMFRSYGAEARSKASKTIL